MIIMEGKTMEEFGITQENTTEDKREEIKQVLCVADIILILI